MKIIIGPSKTMKYREDHFQKEPLLYPKQNEELYTLLHQYTDEQLCQIMNISFKQALKVYDYYHIPQDTYPALSLYQGTVFKQLDIQNYYDHLEYLYNHVNIMSAYYGVLHYNSAIKPYRLDMTMKLPINLYEYWYTPIYQYFEKEDFIISLASQEFTTMINHPRLYFIDFIELVNNKPKRQSMIIKKARGQMLNQMILNEITTLDKIKQLNIDGFIYNPKQSHNHNLVFIREKK